MFITYLDIKILTLKSGYYMNPFSNAVYNPTPDSLLVLLDVFNPLLLENSFSFIGYTLSASLTYENFKMVKRDIYIKFLNRMALFKKMNLRRNYAYNIRLYYRNLLLLHG
jgi:hypothetical protein